jgi:septum site-determining protein MinC
MVSLMAELDSRAIRIIGIEGADPSILDKSLPPLLTGGRTAGSVEAIEAISQRAATPDTSYKDASPPPAVAPAPVASLMIETPVRPDGDVIILGSVASGAEVISSGSIHVYGALRGRALAGAYGNESARVFCRRFEAELIAVGGYYKVLDDIDPSLRQKPVQAWLSGNDLNIAILDHNEKELVTWRKS